MISSPAFAVRDLASHYQLAWHPVVPQNAQEVIPILRALFQRHGRPLVFKRDNGSPFTADVTQQAMLEARGGAALLTRRAATK